MKDLNACLASLNLGLPDDVRRLKEAGYYTEAIARIDAYLAEEDFAWKRQKKSRRCWSR